MTTHGTIDRFIGLIVGAREHLLKPLDDAGRKSSEEIISQSQVYLYRHPDEVIEARKSLLARNDGNSRNLLAALDREWREVSLLSGNIGFSSGSAFWLTGYSKATALARSNSTIPFTGSIDLSQDEADLLHKTACHFQMDLATFLRAALVCGIAVAENNMATEVQRGADYDGELGAECLSGDEDDSIPF